MRKCFLFLISILLPICAFATGRAYVYPDYPIAKIQQIIDESDHIIFRKGVYNVDDNTSWLVKSNKKLTFESGSRLDFTNTRAKQYESLFNIQGDNVVFEGLCFTSSSRCSRSVYGNGPRDGFSSLCTVIRIRGSKVRIMRCKFYNAEIALSIARGNHIKITDIYAESAQTIYATNCNNLIVDNLSSVIVSSDVSRLDHHIYLKGKCANIEISNSHFQGGPSFAIQVSGDYSDPSKCPKDIMISNVLLTNTKRGICVDLAYSDVYVSKIKAFGLDNHGDSYFLSNRGGTVRIVNSEISNFNYIESETVSIDGKVKGSSSFINCAFKFLTSNSTAFLLYYLDSLLVENCSFLYYLPSDSGGFIIRTDPYKNYVSKINFCANTIYTKEANQPYFRIRSTPTIINIHKNEFYNWGFNSNTLFSKDSVGEQSFIMNYSINAFPDISDNFEIMRKARIKRASKKYNKAFIY